MARVFSPYTILDTPVEVERCNRGNESGPRMVGMVSHGMEGAGGNVVVAALAAIPMNNGTTGGTGLDCLLGLALGLNKAQLLVVRETGIEN